MAVTYGFFNSVGGDRRYDAEQFGQLFEGIIRDGIFQNVRQAFEVTRDTSAMRVVVGSGRCWFQNTWTDNDAPMTLGISRSDTLNPRIDLIAIKIDKRLDRRANSIVVIRGVPNSNPVPPALPDTTGVYHYPIAQITIPRGVSDLSDANIQDLRGTGNTPWITGPLSTINLTSTINQIQSEWSNFFNTISASAQSQITNLTQDKESQFNTWFQSIQGLSASNDVLALVGRIIDLENIVGANATSGDRVIYDNLRDRANNTILDRQGRTIQARIVYRMVQ